MDFSRIKNITPTFTNIQFPFVVTCRDYHEFKELQVILEKLTSKVVRYEEIGCDGRYHALFFLPEQEAILNTSIAVENLKKEFND